MAIDVVKSDLANVRDIRDEQKLKEQAYAAKNNPAYTVLFTDIKTQLEEVKA
jgi:hypothetical protein